MPWSHQGEKSTYLLVQELEVGRALVLGIGDWVVCLVLVVPRSFVLIPVPVVVLIPAIAAGLEAEVVLKGLLAFWYG